MRISPFLLLLIALPVAAADAERGRSLYQSRCTACHSIEYNGVGPAHRGMFGRRAGLAPGYAYSPALKGATVIWSKATLERWLTDPEAVLPGQRVGVNVPEAVDRADLIEYLERISIAK